MKKISTYLILIIFSISLTNCFLLGSKDDANDSCYDAEEMNFDQCESTMLNFDSSVDRVSVDLSEEQKNDLIFMWQEEKVARDVYLKMAEKYNIRIFSNIARSEQTHMNAVKSKIDKYNIPVEGYSDNIGDFMDPHFSQLYTTLVNKGNGSLESAIDVGVQIEVLDIADLEERIENAEGDVLRMFKNLLKASNRHLAAFNWWASKFD